MPTLRSPRYNISIPSGTLQAGQVYYINLAEVPECAREIPYNNVTLRNFSNNRLKVEYGDTVMIVGSSEIFADDRAHGTTSIKITNTSNETQDDDIYIVLERNITTDALLTAYITGGNLYETANGDI